MTRARKAPAKKPKKRAKPAARKKAGKQAPELKRISLEEVVALAVTRVTPTASTVSETLLTAAFVAPVRTRETIVAAALMSMAEGVSIRKIATKEGMPFATLYSWLAVPELADQYTRAREAQAMWWVEKALAVASGTDEDQYSRAKAMVESLEDADEKDKDRMLDMLNAGTIQRDKLHTDTLKWAASKFHPRQFGDKLDVTSKGDKLGIEALVAGSFGREPADQ